MIKMAPETAKRCEEKREGRGLSPGRTVRHCSLQPFRRPEDMVHLPGYFVAEDLKMITFPSPLLLVSAQMASYHLDHINRSDP